MGIENARQIFEAARHPKSFVSLDAADHLLCDPTDAEYAARVLAAWAARYLPVEEDLEEREDAHASGYTTDHVTAQIGLGLRTQIRARGLPLVADEPAKMGGTETGPTPFDLVAAGLAACTAMTLRLYADRKKLALAGVDVQVNRDRIPAPTAWRREPKTARWTVTAWPSRSRVSFRRTSASVCWRSRAAAPCTDRSRARPWWKSERKPRAARPTHERLAALPESARLCRRHRSLER